MTYSAEVKASTNYPYGKALRTYGKERYQSTYHERDVESGFDYRGARFYDGETVRFNSLDPLSAEFPEWSDYNYVLGNPIVFIDPNGKRTIYYDEDGNELHRSEDGLDDAVVIISNDNLHAFSEMLNDQYAQAAENGGDVIQATYSDSFNGTLRGLGTNYMVDGMVQLLKMSFDDSLDNPDAWQKRDGSPVKLYPEYKAEIVKEGNIASVNCQSMFSICEPNYVTLGTEDIQIHTHPNGFNDNLQYKLPGRAALFEKLSMGGSAGAPPSKEDTDNYDFGVSWGSNKQFDVVISPSHIWFYQGNPNSAFGASLDFFK